MSRSSRLRRLAMAAVVLAGCSASTTAGGTSTAITPVSAAPITSSDAASAANISVTLGNVFNASAAPLAARLALVEGGAGLQPVVADLEHRDATVGLLRPKVIGVAVEAADVCTSKGAGAGCATASVEFYVGPTLVVPATPILMLHTADGRYLVSRASYCGLLADKQVTCPAG